MMMKVISTVLLTLLLVNMLEAQNISVQKSTIEWTGKKVVGEHRGNVNLKEGILKFNGNDIIGGSFVIDMNSITCTDIENSESNAKLVGHLKSDDFFGIENHPTAKLEIIKATKFEDNKADIKANLTIKGISKPIEFTVEKQNSKYITELNVDRTAYGVRYGSGSFFDNLGDNAMIMILLFM